MFTIEDFHRSRRMFAVINGQLYIAEPNTIESHKEWFIRKKWIVDENDPTFNIIPRGYVDSKNIYAYFGEDFQENSKLEKIILMFIPELYERLNLSKELILCLGAIPCDQDPYPPRRIIGPLKELSCLTAFLS